jgi:hypothetical protein
VGFLQIPLPIVDYHANRVMRHRIHHLAFAACLKNAPLSPRR